MRALVAGLAAGLSIAPASAAAAEPPDCGVARRLPGIDVSSYQGAVDWKQVKAAGVVFAFARVSDGVDVIDERFADNFAAMKRAGVRRGAYQHFRAAADPRGPGRPASSRPCAASAAPISPSSPTSRPTTA